MWNEKTKPLVDAGKLVVIGVVQEQHAQRAKLYKQWKQYDFPIAQDALTSLGLAVVPVPVLLDEFGYAVSSKPHPSNIEQLVAAESPNAGKPKVRSLEKNAMTAKVLAARSNVDSAKSQIAVGDRFFFENTAESYRSAIEHYQRALKIASTNEAEQPFLALAHFRLGVAYRACFDADDASQQDPNDFSLAAEHWTKALALNPNQYIWRRRIQQYGPRQIKPYPFYNWVDQAVSDIKSRDEVPVKLRVSLTEAEVALPKRQFEPSADSKSPDPDGAITRDGESLIAVHTTVVPQRVKPGEAVRVHMRFSTSAGHWNNESDPMKVWLETSNDGKLSESVLTHDNATEASSDEVRKFEFEFQTSKRASETIMLKGYALYNVCKSEDGQCLYRRQDIEIPIQLDAAK